MRLWSTVRDMAQREPAGPGWRHPVAIMVVVQAVTVIAAAVALSGASPEVTAMVVVGWALTLIILTAQAALLYAADRVVSEAERLREMHLVFGAPGALGAADSHEMERADDEDWDGSATVQLPLSTSLAAVQASDDDAQPEGESGVLADDVEVDSDVDTPDVPEVAAASTPSAHPAVAVVEDPAPAVDPEEPTDQPAPDDLLLAGATVSRISERRSSAARATLAALAAFPVETPTPPRRASIYDREPDRAVGSLR